MSAEPLAPMNLWEAVEAMKIISPVAEDLRSLEKGTQVLAHLLQSVQARNPIDVFRLLALMEHRPVEEVMADFHSKSGRDLVMAYGRCLAANPLPDLVSGAFLLGISNVRWSDGRGDE